MPDRLDQTDRPDPPGTRVVFDPATYVTGVPYGALARLRRSSPVTWVDEVPVLGWPGGPGFWLVLRHADVESVLRQPRLFSSWLGATQIRDPATAEALGCPAPASRSWSTRMRRTRCAPILLPCRARSTRCCAGGPR